MQAQSFDAFGNIENQSGDLLVPFGFAGGLTDQDTGLIRFGARDYDPQSARWTSKDPIKFNGDTLNIYRYVNNDPVNLIDPEGLVRMGNPNPTPTFEDEHGLPPIPPEEYSPPPPGGYPVNPGQTPIPIPISTPIPLPTPIPQQTPVVSCN